MNSNKFIKNKKINSIQTPRKTFNHSDVYIKKILLRWKAQLQGKSLD